MEAVTNRRGLRIEEGAVIKDCTYTGIRQGRIMQLDGKKAMIQWGPGKRSSHISLNQIHASPKRRTGYQLLHNWSPMRRRS
jgi:hypothetical protein